MSFIISFCGKNIIFIICALIVFVIQFTSLQVVINYRIFNEDWPFLATYKHFHPNALSQIINVWTKSGGLHTTIQIYYIGILSDLFGHNYSAYHIVNIILKGISALTLFPLILIIFRNRVFAFLSAIFYSMTAGSAGALQFTVKGGEYMAVAFLNIFLISYYYLITKRTSKLLVASSLLFFLTFLLSPSRMFPIFLLVFCIELFYLFKLKNLKNIKYSLLRLLFFYLPVILLAKTAPVSTCCPFASNPQMVIKEVVNGNWYSTLIPFAGIGYSIVTSDFWRFFGKLDQETFNSLKDFITFIFKGPFPIFSVITIFLARFSSSSFKKFFIVVIALNFILEILMFIVASHHFYIRQDLLVPVDPSFFVVSLYASLVALYIFSLSFAYFLEWLKKKNNKILLAIWIGPLFSLIFLLPTWLVQGTLLNYYTAANWYLLVSPIGLSLFFSGIISILYNNHKKNGRIKGIVLSLILVLFAFFYLVNKIEIKRNFLGINPQRVLISDQETLQDKLLAKIGDRSKNGNLILYLNIENDNAISANYYVDSLYLNNIGYWMQFRRPVNSKGCIVAITDLKILMEAYIYKGREKGFTFTGNCVDVDQQEFENYNSGKIFYSLDDFFAFKLKNRNFIDIKNEVLKSLP